MPPIVEVKNITMTYDTGVTALRGINLSIDQGEFAAIMGPSGCGKSTLLHLIAGLEHPTSGEIWIGGERIDELNETQLALLRRRRIGFVFQFFNLISTLSVIENIELPLRLVNQPGRSIQRRAEKLLAELHIQQKGEAAPTLLSGGEQQRVAIARALANTPDIVLADEPTGNLDSVAAGEVLQLFHEARQHGQTLLLATHDPSVAAAADRVIRLKDGLVVDHAGAGKANPE
jgi:putative ABC transport system ATP-binding protein